MTVTHYWTKEASSTISALYTEAIDWSTKHTSPAPDLNSSPLDLNLSLREQNQLNKNDPTQKKMWVAGVATTWKKPMSAFTIDVMRNFRLLSVQAHTNVHDFMQCIRRLTDEIFPDDVAVRLTARSLKRRY